jgi:hypothetical protein
MTQTGNRKLIEVAINGLIAVWTELTRQAAAIHDTRGDLQGSLGL